MMKIANKTVTATRLVKDALEKAKHFNDYNIFQYPFLSEPILSILFSSFNFLISVVTVVLPTFNFFIISVCFSSTSVFRNNHYSHTPSSLPRSSNSNCVDPVKTVPSERIPQVVISGDSYSCM